MIVRWIILLSVGTLLMMLSTGHYLWSEKSSSLQQEAARELRVKWQRIQLTDRLLKDSGTIEGVHRFNDSIETLQIDIAQLLSDLSSRNDLNVGSFQQYTLDTHMRSPYAQLIKQVRVSFSMSAAHIVALLAGLAHFRITLSPWPVDVRSCDIWRSVEASLKADCVVDIYHWGGPS